MANELCDIVRACQRKERWAQKRLYDDFSPMVLGTCLRYVPSRDEAQDLLQETFLTVFDKIGTIDDPQALAGWVNRIAINTALGYVTHQRELLVGDLSDVEEVASSSAQAFDTDRYEVENMMFALRHIPHVYAIIFNAIEVDGMDPEKVCRWLHIKEPSLRSRLSRARQMIKEQLDRIDQFDEGVYTPKPVEEVKPWTSRRAKKKKKNNTFVNSE